MVCPSCNNLDSVKRPVGKHIGEYCSNCDKWLRWVPQDWRGFIWPVGTKHKGHTLISILINDRRYLEWAAENMSGPLQKRAQEALASSEPPSDTPKDPEEMDTFDRFSRHSKPREEPVHTDEDVPW